MIDSKWIKSRVNETSYTLFNLHFSLSQTFTKKRSPISSVKTFPVELTAITKCTINVNKGLEILTKTKSQ